METLYDTPDTDTGDTGVGESWFGGFPDQLKTTLEEKGHTPGDFDTDEQQEIAAMYTHAPDDFVGKWETAQKIFEILPTELQQKYKTKFPGLLNSPALIMDLVKMLERAESTKELRESQQSGLSFKGMDGLQSDIELRDIRDQLSRVLYSHEMKWKTKQLKKGVSHSW